MIDDMALRGLSPQTQKAYVAQVAGLARHFGRSPDRITGKEIQAYLLHLSRERKLSFSSCTIARCALRYFYTNVLRVEIAKLFIPPYKTERRLPEIYSPEELKLLFSCAARPKSRILLMTAYAAGLRASEVTHLKVSDIDRSRMTIRVEQGKGRKDRYTLLSRRLLEELRNYWNLYRPPVWLFPGSDPQRPMRSDSAKEIFRHAKHRACLKKGRGIHCLRHSFATHLLEAGVDLYTIKELLGHTSLRTTMIYLHLTRKMVDGVKSPLDLIDPQDSTQKK
jgi:site-specific recombinase XerD